MKIENRVERIASVVLHNLCLELGDMLPRSMDLTVDAPTNKRRDREEVADILDLTNRKQKTIPLIKRQQKHTYIIFFWNEK